MVVVSARAWRARPMLPNTKAGRRRRERWRRPCHSLARNVRGGSSRYLVPSRAYRGRVQSTWSRCLPPRGSTTIGTTGALTLSMLGALTAHGQAAPRSIRCAYANRTNWVRELPGLVLYSTRCRSRRASTRRSYSNPGFVLADSGPQEGWSQKGLTHWAANRAFQAGIGS